MYFYCSLFTDPPFFSILGQTVALLPARKYSATLLSSGIKSAADHLNLGVPSGGGDGATRCRAPFLRGFAAEWWYDTASALLFVCLGIGLQVAWRACVRGAPWRRDCRRAAVLLVISEYGPLSLQALRALACARPFGDDGPAAPSSLVQVYPVP